jgi:type VI secretion system secreted protein Hcp
MVDSFLRLDGIPGDSTDSEYSSQIQVSSWSWSTRFDPTEKTEREQQPHLEMDVFRFVKLLDRSSPKLMYACASRHLIPRAVLTSRRPQNDAQRSILRVTLSDVRVCSYSTSQAAEADLPVEEFGLSFRSIEFECFEWKSGFPAGVIRSGWDIVADQPC